MTTKGATTARGFPAPVDRFQKDRQENETFIVVCLTKHERKLLNPGTSGVSGRFCLLDNEDGTYELVRYADA